MKNKILLFVLFITNVHLYAQIVPTPVTVLNGVVTLKGTGKLGGNKDNAQLRRYKKSYMSGNFSLQAYFRSLTNSDQAFTGIAFRNEGTTVKTDGGIPMVLIIYQNNTLKCLTKLTANTPLQPVVITPNVQVPGFLKLEKYGNDLKYYYATDAETTTIVNWQLVATVQNVFNNWTNITQNFITGSENSTVQTAVISKVVMSNNNNTPTISCNHGSAPFSIGNISPKGNNVFDVQFDAENLTEVQISVINANNTIVKNYSTLVTTNIISVDVGQQLDGQYTMQFSGKSCLGTATKSFSIGNVIIPAPVVVSDNTTPRVGDNITLTATGCNGTINWYKTNNPTILSNNSTLVLKIVEQGSYYAKCVIGNSVSPISNIIEVQANSNNGGNSAVTFYTNHLKKIPIETQNDKFSVNAFPTIGTKLKDYDNTRKIAKYPVVWHSKLDNFISANKHTWDIGISWPTDIVPGYPNQGGDGEHCLDYILYSDPNTGLPFTNGIDPACSKTVNSFISKRPFQYRVKSEGGSTGSTTDWTYEKYFDEGFEYTRSNLFGYGDNIGTKVNVSFSVTDFETGEGGRFEEIPVLIGMAENSLGPVSSMYGQCINIASPNLSHYPLDYINGGYPTNQINLDKTPLLDGDGRSQPNNVANPAWNPNNKVSISTRNITNKGLIDYSDVWESSEVSCLASAAYHQGDEIAYDKVNKNLKRVTNKFGLNRNAEHIIAHTIYATQVRKYYLRKYFNNRPMLTLAKTLCDRLALGLTNYGNYGAYVTNEELLSKHLPRDLAFLKTMFTAFEGSYLYHWDRNTIGKNIDGNNGDLFGIHLLNQEKELSQGKFSFVDLFDSFDFKLWTAEISYDGGNTWKQEKGVDYIMSSASIPHAQCVTANGIWAVFLARPENTEMKAAKLRILYNGSYQYLDVTPDMWDTTDPTYANTALPNLPDAAKDFYYNLIDLTAGSGSGSGSGNSNNNSTVNPPTITAYPANPVAGNNVTLTATGCAETVKWWISDSQVATGNTYYISNATANISYQATCSVGGTTSTASNVITIGLAYSNESVTITEPNKPAYFFSNNQPPSYYANRSNLPVIYDSNTKPGTVPNGVEKSTYLTMNSDFDAVNDVVYLENNLVKYGINLKRGGQLCYASRAGTTDNLIYNGYDGGFQVQLDATQKLEPSALYGRPSEDPNNNINYNTTMGGDYKNHSMSLIDYKKLNNSTYYVKFRPIMYPWAALVSQVEIEATYTLIGRALKIEYTYTSFRTDGSVKINADTQGWGIPVCFLVEKLNRYKVYTGNNPWTNGTPDDGEIPNITPGQGGSFFGPNTKEFWGLSYNANDNYGFGAINVSEMQTKNELHTSFNQVQKYPGNPQGGVFGAGGQTIMQLYADVNVPDGANYTKTVTSYVALGAPTDIISTFYTLSGH